MGAVTSERGILKLVHPGRYVEILRQPITAAEVMEKNSRHCITRPDVFEYPWIVVKPESVLNLGRVFFIVPNRTIYHLLKSMGSPYQSSRQSHSPILKGTSPLKTYAGMTPKHQEHSQSLEQLLRTVSWPEDSPQKLEYVDSFRKKSNVESWPEATPQELESFRKQPKVDSWPKVIVEYKRNSLEYKENSPTRIGSFNAKDYYLTNIGAKFSEREDKDIQFEHSKQVTMLKSCLKKKDSVPKPRHLRVSFVLPTKDEEDLNKGVTESEIEFPRFSTW